MTTSAYPRAKSKYYWRQAHEGHQTHLDYCATTSPDRFEKKLSCWKGKLMSYGGRLILIYSVLTSMPMFLLSFFEVPVGVGKRLDFYRSRFFWQGDELKRKYRLAKWDIICRPKDQGGLGIENLEIKNRCLLSKWLWKLSTENDAMWAQILRAKYLQTKTLSQVSVRPTDSPFWKGLMKVKQAFFNRMRFAIGNGSIHVSGRILGSVIHL